MAINSNHVRAAALCTTLISGFEGCYTYAYRDPVGIPTICFGHIENVHMGDKMTKQQCKDLLQADLPRYQAMVNRHLKVKVSDNTYAVVTSFTYNCGEACFANSSVLRKINAGDLRGGCEALKLYVYAHKGPVRYKLPGLVNRRNKEAEVCKTPDAA